MSTARTSTWARMHVCSESERFDVIDLSLVYDDQYIVQYARPAQCMTRTRFAAEYDLSRDAGASGDISGARA